ncbi:MAG: PilZ domain-containing protein [Deltaproteobacteria bacterium]|nr:PilZ domain-containing protein [Deltaproteobacteria bacterium]
MENATVWIAKNIAKELGVYENDFPCKIMDLKDLVYELLKDGHPRDVVVLPFMRKFDEVLEHIRSRGITGPVVIYTRGETMIMNVLDLASQGVVFIDSTRFSKPMVRGFITFLQRSQGEVRIQKDTEAKAKSSVRPTRDIEYIKEIFRDIMKKRSRILLTCQFRNDLPTLTVTCEVMQMVGEIETRLILDKFNPEEFVGLYKNMGRERPVQGFVTLDEDTLGFQLKVIYCRMGKMTTLLPTSIYEQKRKFFRVEPDAKDPVIVYILPENAPTKSFNVRDVSEGGIGLNVSYGNLEKDHVYPISLRLPEVQILLGRAKVVAKDESKLNTVNYGMTVEFHAVDEQRLRHYIYKRQAGILASIRELKI